MNDEFWVLKTKAFFHDPPDKTLKIQGHEGRSEKILGTLLDKVSYIPPELDNIIKEADHMVSSLQRISIQVKSTKGMAEPVVDFLPGGAEEFVWSSKNYKVISHNPILIHPVTGKRIIEYKYLTSSHTEFTQNMMNKTSQSILNILGRDEKNVEKIFILSWRFFREYMKKFMISGIADENRVRETINLPADTRTPDHTIWDHMDLVSAVAGAMYDPIEQKNKVISLIAIKISPVQNFIKNARKMKDLWAGSHLLSMLTFIAIRKIIDVRGPDSIIYPYLRGQPFLDLYYRKKYGDSYGKLINTKDLEKKAYVANMPNVVLGIIGIDGVSAIEDIENKYEKEIRDEIGGFLKDILENALENIFNNKDKDNVSNYEKILQDYFEITVKILPIYPDENPNEFQEYVESLPDESLKKKYKGWIDAISELGSYGVDKLDLYPLAYELLMHLLSLKSRERITKNRIKTGSGDKCTMCGEFLPIKEFENHTLNIIRYKEKLCPLCLVKRYYPIYISKSKNGWDGIKVDEELLKMESVSEIAMKSGVFYDGEWRAWIDLFNTDSVDKEIKKVLKTDFINKEIYYEENITPKGLEKLGYPGVDEETARRLNISENYPKYKGKSIPPPKYYSILLMDGDDMGTVLNGEAMKNIEDYIHPDIIDYMEGPKKSHIDSKRLLTPTTHAAISKSLMNFSVNKVNKIVEKYRGRLIYSGGDDVLAFLPRDTGFDAAYEIRDVFSKSHDEDYELLPHLNMSGGLLIAHYKYPLYAAMDMVRRLEIDAKDVVGKNSLAIGYLERSGNYYEVIVAWEIFKNDLFKKLMRYIYNDKYYREAKIKLSPRFIYTLRGLLEKLEDDADANMIYDLFIYQLQQHLEVRKESNKDSSKDEFIKKEFGNINELLKILDHIKFSENKKSTYKLKLEKLLDLIKICLENEGCRGDSND